MSEAFPWLEEYETGNLMVDREHKQLLQLVSLIMKVDKKEDSAERDQALEIELAALNRYVDQHFENEEILLETVGSSFLIKQRLLHDVLRNELKFFWTSGQDIPSRGIISELATWSRDKLLTHFLKADADAFNAPPFAK